MDRRWKAAIAAAATAVGCVAGLAGGSPAAAGAPAALASFTTTIDNPYYPLPPGQLLVYKGVRDGEKQIDRVFVTHQTKLVNGVDHGRRPRHRPRPPVASSRRPTTGSRRTTWQRLVLRRGHGGVRRHGNVVSTEGSWRRRGRRRPGHHHGGLTERHRRVPAGVLRRAGRGPGVGRPDGDERHRARTGPLDQVLRRSSGRALNLGVVDMKFYAPGIGIVLEKALAGGRRSRSS